jgi:hypothetical protein
VTWLALNLMRLASDAIRPIAETTSEQRGMYETQIKYKYNQFDVGMAQQH